MPLERKDLIKFYSNIVLVRKMDEMAVAQSSKGRGTIHSGIGQEATGVAACTFLRKDDYLVPYHRGHGLSQLLSKGMSPKTWFAAHYGRATSSTRGFSARTVDMDLGISASGVGTLGACFTISTGLGMAAQARGKGEIVMCIFGDGTSGRGTFHESMNLAALWKLPIVWICENNQYALWTPTKDAYAKEDIADLAGGYGIPGVVVDGQDVVAVYEAVMGAVERARTGQGPSLIESKTYRIRAHFEGTVDLRHGDPRSEAEAEAWKKRDPVKLFQEKLLAQGILSRADVERIDKELTREVEEAERFGWESPQPDPGVLDKALYAV